ncbi:hypothetical protein ACFXPR_36860 [Nocardia tengchongensis]|uniref:hypothetical protein n=1 Tax=Nocardia tengchongensis TaxID=2055889 RepID=UPI00367B545B
MIYDDSDRPQESTPMHLSHGMLTLVLMVAFLISTVFGLGTALLVIRKHGATMAVLAGFGAAGTALGLALGVLQAVSQLS